MAQSNKLDTYRSKRDFRKTGEPSARGASGAKTEGFFVIQKHDASSLHYDFRLAIDGVLVSWAVPKGPSTDPRQKRLAIRTEDHPLDYADFEGVIPEGQYGAGPVIVWDRGSFENVTDKDGGTVPAGKALGDGHLLVRLDGEKISGGYALQRIEKDGDDEQWLLIKMKDDAADARRKPVSTEPRSVLSGKTLEEVAAEAEG